MGWARRCGLKRVTSDDGYTEWVLPDYEDTFKREGIKALGKYTESGEDRAAKAEAELSRLRSGRDPADAGDDEVDGTTTTVSSSSRPEKNAKSSACAVM